jgi:hypothetical protein
LKGAATVNFTAIEHAGGGQVNIETALNEAIAIDGATSLGRVGWESGMSLGALGGGKSNLAMARHSLKRIESELVL